MRVPLDGVFIMEVNWTGAMAGGEQYAFVASSLSLRMFPCTSIAGMGRDVGQKLNLGRDVGRDVGRDLNLLHLSTFSFLIQDFLTGSLLNVMRIIP